MGDSVWVDLGRTTEGENPENHETLENPGGPAEGHEGHDHGPKSDNHQNVTVDIGAAANPPGFDTELAGLSAGAQKTFDVNYPDDYAITELAGRRVSYDVTIKAVRKRIVPDLDDEFAKDLGD